ncbi:hypothetical protein PSACC_00015 [Paramicrosporidium saccamoebae]|uniref:Uncharacterized protein n=1 Tax=Paramicrosporidium saccamoebae TaxID=1246581 RepID=A0A2H9TQY5_9FUNG|nr:hypothetical protein PSACC_00015 [Paramicrosporidium saccamoebae]
MMLQVFSLLFVAYCYALVVEFDPEVEARYSIHNTVKAVLSSFEINSENMPIVHKVLSDPVDVFHKIYANIEEPQRRIDELDKFMANKQYHTTVFSGKKLVKNPKMLKRLFVQSSIGYYGGILENLPPAFEEWPANDLIKSIFSNIIAHSFNMISSFNWLELYLENCQDEEATWLFQQMYSVMTPTILAVFVGDTRKHASQRVAEYLLEDSITSSERLIRVLMTLTSGIRSDIGKDQRAIIQDAWVTLHKSVIELPTGAIIDSEGVADLCSKVLNPSKDDRESNVAKEERYRALLEMVLVIAEGTGSGPAWSVVTSLTRHCTGLAIKSAVCGQIATTILSKLDPEKIGAPSLKDVCLMASINKGYASIDESLLHPFPQSWRPSFFRTDKENLELFMRSANFEIFTRKRVANSTSFPQVFDIFEKTYDLPWNAFITTQADSSVWIGTAAIDYAERFIQAQKDDTVDSLEYDFEMSIQIIVLSWLYSLATSSRLASNGLLKPNQIQNHWEDFFDDITDSYNLDETTISCIDNLLTYSSIREHFTVHDLIKTISNVTDNDFLLASSEESEDYSSSSNNANSSEESSSLYENRPRGHDDSETYSNAQDVDSNDDEESSNSQDVGGGDSEESSNAQDADGGDSEESSNAQNVGDGNSKDDRNTQSSDGEDRSIQRSSDSEYSNAQAPNSDDDSLSEAAHIMVDLGMRHPST